MRRSYISFRFSEKIHFFWSFPPQYIASKTLNLGIVCCWENYGKSTKISQNPEIFKKNDTRLDKYADLLSDKIFPKIRDLVKNYDNLRYEDINEKIPNDKKYFIDNLHFTKEGNELISKEISQIIKDKYLSQ